MRLSDVPVPATPAAGAAAEVVERFSPPALVNHCWRSYYLAGALAVQDQLDVDWELLHVTSLLHDLSLEAAFDNHSLPFEDAGGHLAWLFAAGAGWTLERRDHAAAVIVAHMRGTDPAIDPEGHLLDVATGLDISGRAIESWPSPFLHELLERYPRLDLGERFITCFRDQTASPSRPRPTPCAAAWPTGSRTTRWRRSRVTAGIGNPSPAR
jgi:hypothetical protein